MIQRWSIIGYPTAACDYTAPLKKKRNVAQVVKKPSILILSFHYPPTQSSSGLLRALAFSRDLAEVGWDVTVLTSEMTGQSNPFNTNNALVPDKVNVIRTCAIDTAKSLAIRGRYPGILEWPDRHNSWAITATIRGFKHQLNIVEFPTIEGQRLAGDTGAPSIPTGIRFIKRFFRELLG